MNISGTNAPTERIFSIINAIWTKQKSNFLIETLKPVISVRTNLNMSCIDFHQTIKKMPKVLEQISLGKKYHSGVSSNDNNLLLELSETVAICLSDDEENEN